MKNTNFKGLRRAAFLLAGALAIAGCMACNRDYNDLIVGVWNVDKITSVDNGNQLIAEGFSRRYKFRDDGSMTLTLDYGNDVTTQRSATWRISDDRLLLTNEGDSVSSEWWTIKSLDKHSMEWYGDQVGRGTVRMRMGRQ